MCRSCHREARGGGDQAHMAPRAAWKQARMESLRDCMKQGTDNNLIMMIDVAVECEINQGYEPVQYIWGRLGLLLRDVRYPQVSRSQCGH